MASYSNVAGKDIGAEGRKMSAVNVPGPVFTEKLAGRGKSERTMAMKFAALVSLYVFGAISLAAAKQYDLPSEHLKVSVSEDWKVTTEADEFFGVTNANNDSFTIMVSPVGRLVDIQQSSIPNDTKTELINKGMEILKMGNLSFHDKKTFSILAKMTKLGFTFYMYEIITTQGNDLLSFILVGDSDPSQEPQFQAILDTVSFEAPVPSAPTSKSPSAAAP
jgi:hypothetical protein